MTTIGSKVWDMLHLIRHGGPALCNIAITNSCNATCDFCNFANGKVGRKDLRWIDVEQFDAALEILHGRGIRYLSFFGGEPLLHPRLSDMIAMSIAKGMGPAVITNGWLLPSRLDQLAASGLKTIYVSIDAPGMADHEANRGLKGLGEHIRSATSRMPSLGMTPLAQVTISKLIGDYHALVPLLRELGFQAVAFSYPQRARLGSSSLAWSADSDLMNFTDPELVQAFEAVDDLRDAFRVNNPRASVADMKRHLRGEPQRFVCYGGYKSFYMDWNFDVWRCDAWRERMCSVWEFAQTPLVRDGCTACIADCYRDSSVMLHFAVSLGDALDSLSEGHMIAALKAIVDGRNLESLGAVVGNVPVLSRLPSSGDSYWEWCQPPIDGLIGIPRKWPAFFQSAGPTTCPIRAEEGIYFPAVEPIRRERRGSYAEYCHIRNMLTSFLFLRCSMKFRMLSLVSVLLIPLIATAQQNGTAPGITPAATNGEAKSALLTNAGIIRMVHAGFGEDTIVGAIQANQTQFDVSVDALVALKKAGATEKVINAMLTSETNKRNVATTSPATNPAPTSTMTAPSPYGSRGMSPGAAATMSPDVQAMMAQMGMAGMSGGNAAMVSSAQMPHITLLDDQQKRELPVATAQIAQTKHKGGSGAGGAMLQGFASQALSFAAMGAGPAGMVAMPIMGMAGGLVPGMHHGTPSMTYIWALPGRQSSTLVLSSTPKFEISFADIVGIDPDQYEPTIVRLVQSKDNWRLVGASKVKMTEMAQGYPESQIAEERLAAHLNKLSPGHAVLEPQKPLDAGEYAVVLHPLHKKKKGSLGGGSEAQVFYSVWDFSVPAEPNSPATKKP